MPGFEQVPAIPERQTEALETGASFESSPSAEAAGNAPAVPEAATVPVTAAPPASSMKDPTVRAVEAVLEEDLGDAFGKMPPALQAKFRKEGERITAIIVGMVRGAKVNARVVLGLIAKWLGMIPGVNRFFLAQEAKIKTDRILKL